LTPFEALIGFRPLSEIQGHLKEYPEFMDLVGSDVSKTFLEIQESTTPLETRKHALQLLFKTLMEASPDKITQTLTSLLERLASSQEKKFLDTLIQRIAGQYPDDVGVYCLLLLNFVKLEPGEAIFLAANEPHAYLSGGNFGKT
jgi:mannose-6-phosphate isomerase